MRKLISAVALAAALAHSAVAAAGDREAAELALERGDYATAAALYQTAGKAGDPRAQVTLGFMYWYGEARYGHAVQGDMNTALDWFARAADQGNVVGSSMLGLLFQEGYAPAGVYDYATFVGEAAYDYAILEHGYAQPEETFAAYDYATFGNDYATADPTHAASVAVTGY